MKRLLIIILSLTLLVTSCSTGDSWPETVYLETLYVDGLPIEGEAEFSFQVAEVSSYPDVEEETPNMGINAAGDRDFITLNQRYRVRQNGTVIGASFYSGNIANTTNFTIKIWRKNGTLYDLVGESENLISGLSSLSIVNLTFASPIKNVQEGDFVGYYVAASGLGHQVYADLSEPDNSTYFAGGVSSPMPNTGANWTAMTTVSAATVIKLSMQAPQAVFIGDSIIAGHTAHYSFLETTSTTDIESTIEYQFGQLTGLTYQNMGKGSETTTQIATRFNNDVLSLNPQVVIIEGGVNDIAGAASQETFISSYTSMFAAAQADDDVQIVLAIKILPWTDGSNTEMQTRDDFNEALVELAKDYSKVRIVDADSYVGQYRSGGDIGNLWDIQTAYDVDGVHFNQAGHTAIAQALSRALTFNWSVR